MVIVVGRGWLWLWIAARLVVVVLMVARRRGAGAQTHSAVLPAVSLIPRFKPDSFLASWGRGWE